MRNGENIGAMLTDVIGTGLALTNFLPRQAQKEESTCMTMQHGSVASYPLLWELENLSLSLFVKPAFESRGWWGQDQENDGGRVEHGEGCPTHQGWVGCTSQSRTGSP